MPMVEGDDASDANMLASNQCLIENSSITVHFHMPITKLYLTYAGYYGWFITSRRHQNSIKAPHNVIREPAQNANICSRNASDFCYRLSCDVMRCNVMAEKHVAFDVVTFIQ